MARAPPCHGGGRRFKPGMDRQFARIAQLEERDPCKFEATRSIRVAGSIHMEVVMLSFVSQTGYSMMETFAARMYAASPVRSVRIEDLDMLPKSGWIPVGTVEFCRAAMARQGIDEPSVSTYPDALTAFLGRTVWASTAIQVRICDRPVFVKPMQAKRFTGFIWPHGGMNQQEFQAIPDHFPVWCSQVVSFSAEWRFYVCRGEIVGAGRYDDGPENASVPDQGVVREIVAIYQNAGAPAGYGLDVGVDQDGRILLVEVNDGWALGLYKGMPERSYLGLLAARWEELLETRPS